MSSALILGAGFGGATAAYLLRQKGFDVTVLEADTTPGGGTWTRFCGGHPYTFGPRIFFTRDEEVYAHMMDMVKLRSFYTRSWTYVESDGQFHHYPI
ncbi:MAG: FAD/NAD(P)-binding protein, partial [Patescibacteria group bacterium]